jgi:MraZ protein
VFLGEFSHNLDDKGRLTIPAKFRDQLVPGLVVTRNPSGSCLLAMPMDEWNRVAERVSALPLTDRRSALLRRALFSAAEDLKPDKQGRILISQRLREFARIESEVVVAGMNTYLELWNPQLWDEQVLSPLQNEKMDEDLFTALGV